MDTKYKLQLNHYLYLCPDCWIGFINHLLLTNELTNFSPEENFKIISEHLIPYHARKEDKVVIFNTAEDALIFKLKFSGNDD